MNKQVWIDTDLSVGMERENRPGYCDVDDGYAILQLMKAENIDIVGMSSVFGNTPLKNAHPLCEMMNTEFAKGKIPTYRGGAEKIDLANVQSNPAVDALAEALKNQKLIIMAIGPATNVGLLLLKYPELKDQIEEVVLVAGRRTAQSNFAIGNKGRNAGDANFDKDVASFEVMFQHGVAVTLAPFEISNKVWLTQKDLDMLAKSDDAGNQWIAKESQHWLQQWLDQGAEGFNPFDVLASHYIISPEDIISEELNARMEIHPNDTVDDPDHFKHYLLCDKSSGYPVKYCYDVVEGYHEKLMRSLMLKS
ncbi:Inosine-uridine nucleoside N-ribohydrolase [Owenweeksia hongkongensis DSM 17368]|uniref:Inosine-uridine nucleoside N-ribohydrolase n=1 Tax=Owenweeksia hongkongensis (strain DSM 17368 / CIP 108786 / JCM 12287 / NRRL B-23963 / UST20020801) TaxID=926562 RepID=G8R1C4_OWEHD|nr:nucleoside hydrolase [Owenweeksia hongkongensis]AEV33867.1 Inosine-uridine nucleoside N-ribohydrolase [Owenweeksia hongkongensis DSM 17368]